MAMLTIGIRIPASSKVNESMTPLRWVAESWLCRSSFDAVPNESPVSFLIRLRGFVMT
jgi:hypothetical protein